MAAGDKKPIYIVRGVRGGGGVKDLEAVEEHIKAKLATVGIDAEVLALANDMTLEPLDAMKGVTGPGPATARTNPPATSGK